MTGPLDPDRLREAVHTVVNRHPNLAARFCEQFDEPVQIIPADPEMAWRYVELDADGDVDEQIERLCAAERAAVCDLADQPAFRVALIRTADRPAPVCADQPPHRARWLVAADPAAGDLRQLLRAATARGRAVPQVRHLAGRAGPRRRPGGVARGARRLRHPHPGRPARPAGARARGVGNRSGVRARPPRPSASWPARTTPPSTPCCRPPGRSC